jgi:phage shock protein A
MHRASLIVSALLCMLSMPTSSAWAFDPFSATAIIGTVSSGLSAISSVASEVEGTASAFSELYSEIDPDAAVSPETTRTIAKLREVESLARELGYTKQELTDLLDQDRTQTTSLSATIQKLTSAIRLGKKVSKLLSRLDKKAQMAQLESTAIQKEQLTIQYRLLNEQISARLDSKKEKLEEIKDRRSAITLLQKEIHRRGGRVFGKTGIYSFPKIDRVLDKSVSVAQKMAPYFAGLICLAFLLRVFFYQIGFYPAQKYGDALRDCIVCLLLLATFPQLIHAAVGISHSLSQAIGGAHTVELQSPSKGPSFNITDLPGSLALNLIWIASWIKYGAFILTDFLFNFGLAFLVLLFPLVIFVSQMLNFSLAWPVFLASFLILTLWPVFWNSTGILAHELWIMSSASITDEFKGLLFSLLQLISPSVCMLVLKGQSLGQAIQSTTSKISSNISKGLSQASGLRNALVGRSDVSALERDFGRVRLGRSDISALERDFGPVRGNNSRYNRNQTHTRIAAALANTRQTKQSERFVRGRSPSSKNRKGRPNDNKP